MAIDTGLVDKVVLVTGANHGIGAATAKAFAERGAAVFVHYWRIKETTPDTCVAESGQTPGEAFYRARLALSADWVVQDIRAGGGHAISWEADLSDPVVIPELFDRAERALGPVDVLVNNAAHCQADTFLPQSQLRTGQDSVGCCPMWTISPDTHDRHFAVNSRAVALTMVEYARRHIARAARWGRIVNLSTDGASGFQGEVSYGASKHALESYSRAAAAELGEYGITVNIVSPGPVQTGYITPEVEERLVHEIPLGRVGQPEDIADVIVFLASEQARWMTGQLLYVGGGHVMPL